MYAIVNNIFRHDLEQYNSKFTDGHLLVLVYMQKYKTYAGQMDFCIGWLLEDLKINRNSLGEIIQYFNDLIDWKLIVLLNKTKTITKNTRLQVKLNNYKHRFTQVQLSVFDKIFGLDIDIRVKKTMLFLYVDIASWIDTKRYCYTSYFYFKKDLGTTSDNRINETLTLLKDNHIIDYENVGQVLIDGKIQQGNNIYVLCSDENYKEILRKGIDNRKKQLEEGKAKIFEGKRSNKMRSLKQKLNVLWKKYDDNNITDTEFEELSKVEKEYYEFIKFDKEKMTEIIFVTDIENNIIVEQNTVVPDKQTVTTDIENMKDDDIKIESTIEKLNDELAYIEIGLKNKRSMYNKFDRKPNKTRKDEMELKRLKEEFIQLKNEKQETLKALNAIS